jgi:hypothetical protein
MILVMPNAFTRYQGSLYSNSVTTGDWEDYVAKELVKYVDSHCPTIADPSGRGLTGHSMGRYGTIRIGMKHPGVYSSLYLLSPCCMMVGSIHPNPRVESDPLSRGRCNPGLPQQGCIRFGAAWSPNPKNPPFFLDLPYKNGKVQPRIVAKWQANAPLAMIDQGIFNLRQYRAIGLDVGTQDELVGGTVGTLDRILNDYGIRHVYENVRGRSHQPCG